MFRAAGVEGGVLRGSGGVESEVVEPFEDLGAALRERLDALPTDPGEVGDPVRDWTELDPETHGQLMTEDGLVQVAGGVTESPESARVGCRPTPVWTAREVRDEEMGVEVCVTGATGAMPERRGYEPIADLDVGATRAAPDHARVALEPAERLGDGMIVSSRHLSCDVG